MDTTALLVTIIKMFHLKIGQDIHITIHTFFSVYICATH
jgi:hypothetical protein